MDDAALYRLMAWLSPAYPVGAYSYSHGLETAVAEGLVADAAGLADWLEMLLRRGDGWVDACLFAAAHAAVSERDFARLVAVAAQAAAQRPTPEIALESAAQGAAFVKVTRATWRAAWLDRLAGALAGGPAYPVAVAASAAEAGILLRPALVAYLHALAANLVSAAVRAVPLGQTEGQAVLAGLLPAVEEVARRAPGTALDEIAAATPMIDWCSMVHETQYARIFRS